MSSPQKRNATRPLSPHLTIYRPQISSVLSILHRITGVGLTVGLTGLVLFFLAVASSKNAYDLFRELQHSVLGLIISAAVSVAFFYHMFNGIRHLYWDAGHGYSLPSMARTGYAVLIATVISVVLFWAYICTKGYA